LEKELVIELGIVALCNQIVPTLEDLTLARVSPTPQRMLSPVISDDGTTERAPLYQQAFNHAKPDIWRSQSQRTSKD
jgi:hypothetical protein